MTDGRFLTRSAFAATMGVHAAQVTRWAKAGMPARSDGMVEAAEAATWVREHVDETMRRTRSIGAAEERRGRQTLADQAFDEAVRLAIWLMAQEAPAIARRAAIEAGLDEASTEAVFGSALEDAPRIADRLREFLRIPPGELGPFRTMEHMRVWPDGMVGAPAGEKFGNVDV